jgi:3-phenylpropionate/trans-cinnamate dioxygenase ferredoxin subunit
MRQIVIGKASDVPEGEARVFEAEGVRLAVSRVHGSYYAIDDLCTHDDGPLGEGCLIGHEIECPRHGARFDVRTGEVRRMPAAYPVNAYKTWVRDGQIVVEIDQD